MTDEEKVEYWAKQSQNNEIENLRFSELMDRLEKFLDKQEQQPVPEVIPQPIELVHPEDLDEVLEEMATSGLISAPQMRRIVNAVRPILEENARLKAGL
ncbi:MAG TPA: hypothetical protein VFF57_12140 [Hanamia sp.]|nr:hypothetical protein [Hanamia sp.]